MLDWIGHMLRRNLHLKHIIEERIEGMMEGAGRRRRRSKQLLDDLKEKKGYWKLMGVSTRSQSIENLLWI
jgi:hypothetical protein